MKVAAISAILILVSLFLVMGCSSPPQAKDGDTVRVHYTGTLEDGEQFDSSEGKDPLQFVVGSGQMIAGFDKGVVGMMVGEKKTITLTPDEAYGYPQDDRIQEIDRAQLPPDINPEAGMELMSPSGFPVKITAVSDSTVTIDANHPLAGKTLTFELELAEIVEPEPEVEPEAEPATEGEG